MAEFGTVTVVLAFVAALWAVGAAAVGHRQPSGTLVRSAGIALRLAAVSLTVSAGVLVTLFLTRDFSVRYVAEYSDSQLPTAYTVAAFWAGQDGSLLLWAWLLAGAAVLVLHQQRGRHRELMPIVIVVLALVLALFTGLVATLSNPFVRLPFVPEDGAGLNAMLQNWGQLYHPPALFLGYIGFTVPFAFSIAALVTGRTGTEWVRAVRRWMISSWALLGLGILLGARWAYTELGWGGYWAWDPVENVSLLPWLTATAYLHSAVVQERRGTLRISNLVLAVATFVLTLFGTFLVRSGVASSVHAFAESSAGNALLAAIVVVVIAAALLLTWRLPLLRVPRTGERGLTRDRLVVLTNAVLLGLTLAILWGTLFPVVTSTLQGREVTVGARFFDLATLPFTVLLLVLTGVCPLVAWRRATAHHLRRSLVVPVLVGLATGALVAVLDGARHPVTTAVLSLAAFAATTLVTELRRGIRPRRRGGPRDHATAVGRPTARNHRRLGALVVHLGIVLLVVGVALDVTYRSDERITLAAGERAEVGGYVLTLAEIEPAQSPTRTSISATLDLARASGSSVGTVTTERYLGINQDQPRTHVGVRSLLRGDIYVILEDVDVGAGTAGFHVFLHPGVLWIWIGGGALLLGGGLAMWPARPGGPASAPSVTASAGSAPRRAGDDLELMISRRRERMERGEAER
jgi:cytochrome c-type biogenesis protein CcmF